MYFESDPEKKTDSLQLRDNRMISNFTLQISLNYLENPVIFPIVLN